jgi:hypothetical protein
VHEKKAENTVKNRFAVILNSLRFNLPANLYPRMLADIAATLNMIPTARSKPHTPVLSLRSSIGHQGVLIAGVWLVFVLGEIETPGGPSLFMQSILVNYLFDPMFVKWS